MADGGLAGIRYGTARPTVAYTPFKEEAAINCSPAQLKEVPWEDVLTGALTEMYGDDFTYLPKSLKEQLVKDLATAYTAEVSKSRSVTDRSASNASLPFNYNFDAWHNISYQRFDSTHCGFFDWLPVKYGEPPKVELDTAVLTAAADKALEAAKPRINSFSQAKAMPGELVTFNIFGENFIPNSPFPADPTKATTVLLGKSSVTPVVTDNYSSIAVTMKIDDNAAPGLLKLTVETRYGKAELDFEVVTSEPAPEPEPIALDVTNQPASKKSVAPASSPNLRANPLATACNLSWTKVSGATSYIIFQDGDEFGSFSNLKKRISGLIPGQEYSFTVRARNEAGQGPESAAVECTPEEKVDAPPPAADPCVTNPDACM